MAEGDLGSMEGSHGGLGSVQVQESGLSEESHPALGGSLYQTNRTADERSLSILGLGRSAEESRPATSGATR
jgi:hypothetical protein